MAKKTIVWILTAILLLSIIVAFYFAFRGINDSIDRNTYPLKEEYSELIAKYSEIYGVPKSIIWAVIKTESGFDPDSISRSNAKGLMQITENTRAEIQSKIITFEYENAGGSIVFNPETNVKLGIFGLSALKKKYGDPEIALAAFIAGEKTVDKWISDVSVSGADGVLSPGEIPSKEVRSLIASIKEAAKKADSDKVFDGTVTRSLVLKYSEYYGVDKNTVLGIISERSKNIPDAVSEKGEKGLMLLSNEFLSSIKEKYSPSVISSPCDTILFDPETNIKYGTLYLSQLYKKFENWDLAVAAYYAGPSNISKWTNENAILDETGNLLIANVPDENTKQFVTRVTEETLPFSESDATEMKYEEYAEKYSIRYGVPKNLIRAMILVESGFDPRKVSVYNAKGLMQLTDAEMLSIMGENESGELLFDPEININYGTFYLLALYTRFGSWETALAAYNAGPTRVSVWLDDPILVDEEGKLIVDKIPFGETESYVKKVLEAANKYISYYYPDEKLESEEVTDTRYDN